ncbi:MAG: DegT/DnrJ/EryC1/StrS family aminotransferase [Planctomycetota bacterium]|jgi:perosamine synthetase
MPTDVPLSAPDITQQEIQAVTDVLRSGRLSIGPRQDRFQELVAQRAGRRHGIAVNSGTSALHLVLLALGVRPGDEVITTPFSFVASANCILQVGARPVFVDIDPVSHNLDPKLLEDAINENTKAIIAVEVFGNPLHMNKIAAIAQRNEVPLVEDACEGLGGKLGNRPVGSFGRAAVFGFYPNKQITTGEGGMIVTDDDRLADLCLSLRNQGRSISDMPDAGSWLQHDRLGFNYRMSEINAALGIVQMERLDEIIHKRQRVARMYFDRLIERTDISLPTISPDTHMSWFVFVIKLVDTFGAKERDRIVTGVRRHDIGCANYFPPIHLMPHFKERFGYQEGDFPVTESVANRTIALPFFNNLDATQIELACLTLNVMLQREHLLKPGNNQ